MSRITACNEKYLSFKFLFATPRDPQKICSEQTINKNEFEANNKTHGKQKSFFHSSITF